MLPLSETARRADEFEQLFDDEQVRANGLVQSVEQPWAGTVRLLGGLFKVDGEPTARGVPAPGLDEHRAQLLETGEGAR